MNPALDFLGVADRSTITLRQCFFCGRVRGPRWAKPWLTVLRREGRIRMTEEACDRDECKEQFQRGYR